MPENEDLPYIVIERRSGGLTAFVWGAVLGAGVALIFAPRSGEETQAEIRRTAERVRSGVGDRVSVARDSVTGAVARTKDGVQHRIDGVRDAVDDKVERARAAVGTSRRVATDARSQLEKRIAEAKEGYQIAAERVRRGPPAPPEAEVVVLDVVMEGENGEEGEPGTA